MTSPATSFYFERFGFAPPALLDPPHPNLGMVVVIPCFNEPDLVRSLESLWRCDRPEGAVEVIVVVNSSESSAPEVVQQNQLTLREAAFWSKEDCDRYFRIHLLDYPNLPRKQAGVGLARKIGMDEALRRLGSLNRLEAPIVCFDADSQCDSNYLVEIESFFQSHPGTPGCSIYFEHPLEGSEPSKVYEAITRYELHLRYYVEALRFAEFPHAFHTIGSSMAVRAHAYMKQGGMNKRKAGEDFYFLHKIIPLGNFGEINSTRVIPSPRPSDRVPFGTGRSVREFLDTGSFETYPLAAFRDLNALFSRVTELFDSSDLVPQLAAPLQTFLFQQKFADALDEIRRNTSTPDAFRNRFFRRFDGFTAMKYIHFARDAAYGPADIISVARELLQSDHSTARDLLMAYRARQRNNPATVR